MKFLRVSYKGLIYPARIDETSTVQDVVSQIRLQLDDPEESSQFRLHGHLPGGVPIRMTDFFLASLSDGDQAILHRIPTEDVVKQELSSPQAKSEAPDDRMANPLPSVQQAESLPSVEASRSPTSTPASVLPHDTDNVQHTHSPPLLSNPSVSHTHLKRSNTAVSGVSESSSKKARVDQLLDRLYQETAFQTPSTPNVDSLLSTADHDTPAPSSASNPVPLRSQPAQSTSKLPYSNSSNARPVGSSARQQPTHDQPASHVKPVPRKTRSATQSATKIGTSAPSVRVKPFEDWKCYYWRNKKFTFEDTAETVLDLKEYCATIKQQEIDRSWNAPRSRVGPHHFHVLNWSEPLEDDVVFSTLEMPLNLQVIERRLPGIDVDDRDAILVHVDLVAAKHACSEAKAYPDRVSIRVSRNKHRSNTVMQIWDAIYREGYTALKANKYVIQLFQESDEFPDESQWWIDLAMNEQLGMYCFEANALLRLQKRSNRIVNLRYRVQNDNKTYCLSLDPYICCHHFQLKIQERFKITWHEQQLWFTDWEGTRIEWDEPPEQPLFSLIKGGDKINLENRFRTNPIERKPSIL